MPDGEDDIRSRMAQDYTYSHGQHYNAPSGVSTSRGALLVAAVVLCRLRCTRFRQQRRLNQHAEIINVPLLNDVEAEQSALRETFQENDDDYGEYIGKVNLLTSPEVFRELQETRLQQNIDERNLNPQKDHQDVFDASAAPSCTSIDIHGENDAKLDLTILEKLESI